MAEAAKDAVTPVVDLLVAKAVKELEYLRHYNNYVVDFEKKKESLIAKRDTLLKNIKEAKDKNESEIENEVDLWLRRADGLIKEDTKGKKKWFGLVTNCCWQYKQGKELAGKIQEIEELMGDSTFTRVARSTGLPGIEFYASHNFMHLNDRKSKFEELKEALKDDNKFRIGLYGLGGTGKTTMAIQVGEEITNSKVFEEVIFTVVSKDPNLKEIRDNIAKRLSLTFKGEDESEQAQELWKRIAEGEEKVLIVLDDAWEKLTLREIGIHLGRHGKGRCAILLTTRDESVCRDMECDGTIELKVLDEKDAVDLFLSFAGKSIDDSSNDFKDVAKGIVKECGRLPVAIVAVARALMKRRHQTESEHLTEWKQGLERLQNRESIHGVDEELQEAYNSLRLSYDYLKNEKAKQLFLLCSLFHEDYEIPIELLTRIAIGLGLCGTYNSYSVARSRFPPIIKKLTDSCLLLNAENGYVKMHDLVRGVALWIRNKLVQVAIDSSTTLMENIQYSSWNINDFPSHFDGRTLEVLLLWISNIAYSTTVTVPDGIFEGMENLKFLALMNWSNIRISCASLCQSHLSLINVRTLAIKGFELGEISILANLKSLESLELSKCSIIELPNEIRDLKKLRLLEIVECDIQSNNPFEVIGSCLRLEELYFVENRMEKGACKSPFQITTFPKLERYQIKALRGYSKYKVDFSISGYFDSNEHLEVNFSNKIFNSLMARAEVLKLNGDYYNRGWTNVVPDILPVKDDSKEDHLTRLCLQFMKGIECLICTERHQSGVAIFSKLVKLKLYFMDVRELCCGSYPVNFLKQLEKLHLSWCENLEGSLFDGKLELCNLKAIHLHECSITCLFHPFTAQCLKQLEKLYISKCSELKYIVAEPMEDHDLNQKSHDSIFPRLKYLVVMSCPELEFILPICFCKDLPLLESLKVRFCKKLKYIFGQYQEERDLHQMGKEAILQSLEKVEIFELPNFISIYVECYLPSDEVRKSSPSTKVEDGSSSLSKSPLCWFWPKSNASTIYHPSPSMNHNQASKVKYAVVIRAHGPFTSPLYPSFQNLSKLRIKGCKQLKFILSASTSRMLQKLGDLNVSECEELVSIIEEDEESKKNPIAPHQVSFPELRTLEVSDCKSMKYLFSISSGKLPRLSCVDIKDTPQLGEVFRRKHGEGQELVMEDVFPKLYMIRLVNLPALHTICQGIDFHTVILRHVRECPAISLTSANDSFEEQLELLDSFGRDSVVNVEDIHYVRSKISEWINSVKVALYIQKAARQFMDASISPNLSEIGVKGSQEDIGNDSTMPQQNNGSPNFAKSEKVSKDIVEEDSTTKSNLPNLTESTKTSANEIVEEKLSTISSSDSNMNLKPTFGEGPCSKKYGKASSSKELRGKESMGGDQQALGEIRSSNNEAPQRVEELTNKCSSKETSNEMALVIPQHITGRTSPPPQIATSVAQVEKESGSSAITDQSIQDNLVCKASSSTPSELTISNQGTSASTKELSEKELEGDPETLGESISLHEGPPRIKVPTIDLSTKETTKEVALEIPPTTTEMASALNIQETFGEGPLLERYDQPSSSTSPKQKIENPYTLTPSKELCGKESMDDQQELGESGTSNETPRRVEEPTGESSSKETSNEVSLKIPPSSVTEMTFALSSSISSPKKPEISNSTTYKQMESGISQSDLSTISAITNESVQEHWKAVREGYSEHIQIRIPTNLSEIKEVGSQQDTGNGSTMGQQNNGSPNFENSEKVSKEIVEENSTTNSNLPNLIENLKATFEEGPSSEKYGKASSLKELHGKESMDDDHLALGESRSSNEAPQTVEEPTKETSNKMALTIPPFITRMISPLPQIATSATRVEMESWSSTITDQSPHSKITNQPRTSSEKKIKFDQGSHQQFVENKYPHDNLVRKASSSTPPQLTISNQGTTVSTKESKGDQEALGESTSLDEGPPRAKEPTVDLFTKETTKEVALEFSPSSTTTKMTSLLVEIMTNDHTCADEEEMKFDQKSSSQIFEEHDLMRLFQMMKEGADMEVDLSYVSKLIADLQDNKEATRALADLEALLKMGLTEIACSEESRLRLQNALNILSSHCYEDGAPSHDLQATIHSLQQEIQTIISSFSQAYATIDTFTKLDQKEKLMIEQRSQREKDAKTLLSDINTTRNSVAEAQLNEAELKEQISKLQADLRSKEKEIKEYEKKLQSLQEQEKKSVSDTIGFTMKFLAMEKERSHMVEDRMKARQQLDNMEAKWSSCLSNLKKTMMLLGVHLKQKL